MSKQQPLTRGQKAAQTRARNKAAQEQAESRGVFVELAETNGMLPMGEWQALIEGLQSAEDNLNAAFAIVHATILLEGLDGIRVRCVWDGQQWQIGDVS